MGLIDALRDPRFRSDLATNAGQLGQSMSNTIVEGVTVPVDALAWLLRKGGVNIPQNPIGGSDWAAQQGLTRQVPQGAPKIAGEMLGLLAPMAATKQGASKIAGGLLGMVDNLAKPRTMNPQTGAIVWHGSPHKFDKFDASKIGTGEGAQAYGHGLYLAESPDVAQGYKTTLSPYELVKDGKQIPYEQMDAVTAGVASDIASKKGDLKAVRSMYENMANQKFGGAVAKQRLAALDSMGANVGAEKGGSLYKVDLPDEAIAKMLDWDKPFKEQPKFVQNALKNSDFFAEAKAYQKQTGASYNDPAEKTGEGLLKYMRAGTTDIHGDMGAWSGGKTAEEYLRSQGIPGIRYLDGGSRGAGQGSSNFVVFPGNENMLRILERNGQGLLK